MFAYCGNNPINLADGRGTSASLTINPNASNYDVARTGGGGGGIIIWGIEVGESIVSTISTFVDTLWDRISRSYARSSYRGYKTPREVHHLVAKEAWNAAPAAAILNSVLENGVENPLNKISIKTGLHRRLHTKLYYGLANAMVISAYNSSDDPVQQKENVIVALGILMGIVSYLDSLAPY